MGMLDFIVLIKIFPVHLKHFSFLPIQNDLIHACFLSFYMCVCVCVLPISILIIVYLSLTGWSNIFRWGLELTLQVRPDSGRLLRYFQIFHRLAWKSCHRQINYLFRSNSISDKNKVYNVDKRYQCFKTLFFVTATAAK